MHLLRTVLHRQRARSVVAWIGLAALGALFAGDARGDGVAQVMTSKSLPDATVDVIDPESGTSSGTSGSDVRIAVGDIILFRFAFTPVPDKVNRGLQSWLTEYLPPNTEVVGVRIVDAAGNTLEPRRPGIGVDGCQGGSACNSFGSLPCASGTCSFATGSIAQVHADTGVFVTTDPRLGPTPDSQFITMNDGVVMNPEPAAISPGIVALLGDTVGPYYAHNAWDWAQVRAYGVPMSAGNTGGDGNTPFGYGSPVAGPDTFYRFEASETGGGAIQFNNVVGPWTRVRYPGSLIGAGTSPGTGSITRVGVETTAGWDLTPANPVDATAVRVALGETRTGEPGYVEVALRVTGVPIDPTFGAAGGNVDCGEVVGSDTASRGTNSGAKDNSWPTYVASPACVFLRLLFDLDVDQTLSGVGGTLDYTLRARNLSVDPETNVVARLKFDGSRQSFTGATPAPASVATCTDDGTKQCVTWNLGTMAPADEEVLEATFTVGGGGQTTNVMEANYRSDQMAAPGFSTQALTIVSPIAVPKVNLAPGFDPTATFVNANANATVTGTVANLGTASWTQSELTVVLPSGWTLSPTSINLGGTTESCDADCTSSSPRFTGLGRSYTPNQSRTLSFNVHVPTGTAAGLYPVAVSTKGGQSGFGGDFETFFPKAAFVNVLARRSQRPAITCPVISTAPSISGTSEASATVRVLFNLLERGSGTATAGGAWTVSNYQAFGEMYGGLELRASAQAPNELPSELSLPCFVTGVRACSDGLDNDGDGRIDFPADPGCTSPGDNSELDPAPPQCSDGVDNNGSGGIDWPADPSCIGPYDPTEDGVPACSNGLDDDGDGRIDFPADSDCTSAGDGTEVHYAACQDGRDNDGDGRIDFPADPGCDSAFDDQEVDTGSSPLDTKPRLLLAFDSSGSMNWNTCADVFTGGDGSSECAGADVTCPVCGSATCGNGRADDSRLAKVKGGISDAVAAFGEVEYALMRFHQRSEAFECPTRSASLRAGGWQGGGAAPCGGGFNAGDLLVSYAQNNEQSLLGWIDGDSNYDGVPPPGTDFEIRGSGTTPLAGILQSARGYLDGVRATDLKAACRPYRVILITDGQETCGGSPTTVAGQLRTAGIPVHVIGFATPDQTVITALNAIATAGGTTRAIFVDDEAALSQAIADIVTGSILVEECNGRDDDCDSRIDEDFPDVGAACDNGEAGECLRPGTRVCAADGDGTVCDAPAGTPGTEVCNNHDDDCDRLVDENLPGCNCVPLPEICNGRDDDCDGRSDEGTLPGVGDTCGVDIGACSFGHLACVSGQLECQGGQPPVVESCNRTDDDCDTIVDEVYQECYEFPSGCQLGGSCQGTCRTGVRTCTAQGTLGACDGDVGPAAERCNALDDDCDGRSDETFPGVGDTCTNGQLGACRLTGVVACTADGSGTLCTAPPVPPGIESCNGLDDDCDGRIDEQLGAPIGQSCGGGAGCTIGHFECRDGEIECVGSVGGQPEVCNGLDDDCDDVVDELPLPGTGDDCVDPGHEQDGDRGECAFGTTVCRGGQIVCDGYIGPHPEVCNSVDDDCDGEPDDVACAGAGEACIDGECALPCSDSEFPCPFGYQCRSLPQGDFCVSDPCRDVQCPVGFGCSATGECVDLCEHVTCGAGETCVNGLCRDCFVLGCPDGQLCVRGSDQVPTCIADPCTGVDCGSGGFCRDGDCVALHCDPACAGGQICREGTCVTDPCTDVHCGDGQVCDSSGQCVDDRCRNTHCRDGEACRPSDGQCIGDPCATIDCPDGTRCVVTYDGVGTCAAPVLPARERVTAAGGGCSAGGGDSGGLVVGLALLGLVVRRRRAR